MGEYIPAPYLAATSFLTDEQLRRCYQDFARSLEYAATAPTLVFERLVANIVECLKTVARDTPSEARTPAAPPSQSPSSPPGPPPPPIYPSRGSSSSNAGLGTTTTSSSQVVKSPRQPATGTFHTAEALPHNMFIGTSKFITFSQPYPTPPRIVTGLRWLSITPSGTLRATSYARSTTTTDFTITADDDTSDTKFSACASWLSAPPENPDFQVGTFSTTEDHPSNDKKRELSRRIVFERAYAQPPQVAVWFSGFQFEGGGNPKAETWCDDVTATGFLLVVSSREESTLFSADVAWAACSHDRPNTWMGTFRTSRPFPRRESGFRGFWGSNNGGFKEESTSVFLAINSIAANMGHDVNLRISCLKVDKSGLSWYISTWDSSQVTQVGATFIVLG